MPRIKIDTGLHLFYKREGQGDTVTLVQGLDRDHKGMTAQTRALSEKFQVISYDARGTGQSDTPPGPYTCAQMSDDLRGLLKALGIAKTSLIGASLGGQVVQEFAIHYPEMTEAIILMCTFAKPDHYLQTMGRFWIDSIERIGHAQLCEEIMHWAYSRTYFETERQKLETAREKLRGMEATYNIRGFQWKAEAGINGDTRDRIGGISAPTLVMAGELDYFVPPALCEEQLVRPMSGARFVVIKGAAHAFFEEKADEVNREILDFLSSVHHATRSFL